MALEPLYPVDGNALLSAAAQALEAEVLALHTILAEEMLGLADTSLSGDDAEKAALANTLQVNFQVGFPADAWYVKSETRGKRSITYRDGVIGTDPNAQAIVDVLIGGATGGWSWAGPRR